MRRVIVFTFLTLGVFFQLSAQVEVDSIRSLIPEARGTDKVDLLNTLASRLITISPMDVEKVTAEALDLAEQFDYSHGIIRAWVNNATLWSRQNDFVRAKEVFDKALKLALSSDDLQAQVLIKNGMGANYGKQGRYAESIEAYLQAVPLAKEINDLDLAASLFMNMGRTKELLSEFDEADSFYQQAMELYSELGDKFRMGQLYINLGVLEYKKQNLGRSVKYNSMALEIFDGLGDKAMTALSLQNLGFAYATTGQHQRALSHYARSYELRKQINDAFGMGKILLNRAKVFEEQGNQSESLKNARASMKIASDIDHKVLVRDVSLFLYNLFRKKQDHKEALEYYMVYAKTKDTLNIMANQSRVSELTARFDFDKLRDQNQLQLQQNEIKDLKIRQRNQLIRGLLFMFLLLIIIFYNQRKGMRYRLELSKKDQAIYKQEKELATKELEVQKEKLVSYANKVLLKDNILAEAEMELSQLKSGRVPSGRSLSELIDGLNASISEQDWLSFKLYFEATYPQFFEKLRDKCHEPSTSDQRLAAMIKIGLSNKEIAAAFNISPDSVVRAKHRLRQKLDFASPQEMEDFVISL
ncbi:MAG: tetratricopeptide repeat protein [Roseivirga sp.]|nr:tetratricopeptide repeat protein [Roseivirga sp.]